MRAQPTQPQRRPAKPQRAKPSLKISRVTIPRYSVEFPTIGQALLLATQLHDKRVGVLAGVVGELPGTEVVLDFSVAGLAFSVSLLFRILQPDAQQTVVEWWARRQTDPALLELWIDALETHHTRQTAAVPKIDQPDPETIQAIFELCRRSLSKNPFTVLGLHWSCTVADIKQAYTHLFQALKSYKSRPGLSPRAYQLLGTALERVPHATRALSTREGRVAARKMFVPENQLSHARELVASKIQVAALRGDKKEIHALRLELVELG